VSFIQHHELWWKRASAAFGLPVQMNRDDLAAWMTCEDIVGGLSNGLEMILWLYGEKEKDAME